MRIIGYILAGCVAVAVLRAAFAVLMLAYLGALTIGLWTRPKETVGLIAIFVLIALFG